MVRVGRHEWFVFRRYTEFDKLYNAVSDDISSECVHSCRVSPKHLLQRSLVNYLLSKISQSSVYHFYFYFFICCTTVKLCLYIKCFKTFLFYYSWENSFLDWIWRYLPREYLGTTSTQVFVYIKHALQLIIYSYGGNTLWLLLGFCFSGDLASFS